MSSIRPRGGRKQGDFFYLAGGFTGFGNGTLYFSPFMAPALAAESSSTETAVDISNDFKFLLRRVRVNIMANAVSGASVIAFRRNAATPTGASVTFASTVTGQSTSGVLSHAIEVGDLINFMVDVTDAAADTITGTVYALCERVDDF